MFSGSSSVNAPGDRRRLSRPSDAASSSPSVISGSWSALSALGLRAGRPAPRRPRLARRAGAGPVDHRLAVVFQSAPRVRRPPATPRPTGRPQPARRGQRNCPLDASLCCLGYCGCRCGDGCSPPARRHCSALPTVLAFFSGGFFDKPRLAAALAAWALVVVVARAPSPQPLPRSRPGPPRAAGAVPAVRLDRRCRSPGRRSAARAQDDLQRLLLYLGFLIAASRCCAGRRAPAGSSRRWCWARSSWSATGSRSASSPASSSSASSGTAAGRLEQPLTYWNASASWRRSASCWPCASRATSSATAPAARGRRRRRRRLGLGVYLTFARGALGGRGGRAGGAGRAGPGGAPAAARDPHGRGRRPAAALVANELSTVKSLSARDSSEGR